MNLIIDGERLTKELDALGADVTSLIEREVPQAQRHGVDRAVEYLRGFGVAAALPSDQLQHPSIGAGEPIDRLSQRGITLLGCALQLPGDRRVRGQPARLAHRSTFREISGSPGQLGRAYG